MNTDTPESIWDGIESCPDHLAEATPDCQVCCDEMTARTARLEQMQAEVQNRLNGLRGMDMNFPPEAIDHIRLETLIELILNGRNGFYFEGEAGRRIIETMKRMQSDTMRKNLQPDKRLTVVRNSGRPKP